MNSRVIENITEFSDDILLNVFSKLNSWDLLGVLETCRRFSNIGRDLSLWKRADFGGGSLSAAKVFRKVLPCLGQTTTYIHLKGHKRKRSNTYKGKTDLITPAIMKNIGKKCPLLKELHFSEAVVNARKFVLENLQRTNGIHTLTFVDCEFICLPAPAKSGSYFKNMSIYLPFLENLEVSYSNWITDFDLMVLSKLDNLKKLVLKCDIRIGFTTAYLAISFRFGFKNLQELDLRGTSIQNTDVQSVVQSEKLKCLKLGPIGKVKRLSNDLDRGLGLVIPDPNKRDEPKQQIVVINMNPNGPRWRHASDDDLEELGLQWVKKELNRCRRKNEEEMEPFFFGEEGKKIRQKSRSADEGESSSGSSRMGGAKRKAISDSDTDDEAPPTKQSRSGKDASCSEDELYENPLVSTEEESIPDEGLSDMMVPTFRHHAKNVKTLLVNGCALTDSGFLELVKNLPLLSYIDVSNSYVTAAGIQQAQVLLPYCQFIDDKPIENR